MQFSPSPLQLVLLGLLIALLPPTLCLWHLRLLRLNLQQRPFMTPMNPQLWVRGKTLAWLRLRTAVCISLLMLSGCGTPPSPVRVSCPPLPAELMQGPQSPVLLGEPSVSKTPGTTRLRTPSAAASTASATAN